MNLSISIIAAFLTGSTLAKKPSHRESLLQDLFGNIIRNGFPLKNLYFTLRPDSAPPSSPLYRFNLTYGEFKNISTMLTPKDDEKTMYENVSSQNLC
uniref:Uncharacterized protein n=1 Tax=Rhipicephalus appendiculatus TaxID=34631 RepID=A0A131YFU1_RHIAP